MHDPLTGQNERLSAPPLIDTDQVSQFRKRWGELVQRYLSIVGENSIWRYSRKALPADIGQGCQGWKLHLSATILTAGDCLEIVAPYLAWHGIVFKAVVTLDELAKLNSGLWYGYSQIGKSITIYPSSDEEFQQIAGELHRRLPLDLAAPAVPFDHRYASGSNIYFRYGAFATRILGDPNKNAVPVIRAPNGEMVPDRRDTPSPDWVKPPIPPLDPGKSTSPASPLSARYRVFRSISQRGKGGVYEALDTSVNPYRPCIVKEGRQHGETAWDGRDGSDRVRNEAAALRDLSKKGVPVPRVFDEFELEGNSYTVLEKLSGQNLCHFVTPRRRRHSIPKAIDLARQISRIVAAIHSGGWAWRDCKPSNFIFDDCGRLHAIDLEGACRIDQPDPYAWATPNFAAPEIFDHGRSLHQRSNLPEDLYSLGVCLFFLFEGRLPERDPATRAPLQRGSVGMETSASRVLCSEVNCTCISSSLKRRGVPRPIKQLIRRLTCRSPKLRPSAEETCRILNTAERDLLKKRRKPGVISDGVE